MCDAEMIRAYGLVGAFDTVTNMRGEEIAVITGRRQRRQHAASVGDGIEEVNDDVDDGDSVAGPHGVDDANNVVDDAELSAGPATSVEANIEDDDCGDNDDDDDDDDYDCDQSQDDVEWDGISFIDIQFYSEQLAAILYHRFGVRAHDPVVIICHRHLPAEITSILACARIGAPFVPLDDTWLHRGANRIASIIEDCSPVAAIVVGKGDTDESVKLLAAAGLYRCVYLHEDGSVNTTEASAADFRTELPPSPYLLDEDEENMVAAVGNLPPLYILYTSGSTGRPKGVLGSHWGLTNRIAWQCSTFPWALDEVACRRTPLTFVDSMVEIFAPLLAAIPLWKPLNVDDGLLAFAPVAATMGVSRLTLLPSQLQKALMLEPSFAGSTIWPQLKYIHVSGEPCSVMLVEMVKKYIPQCVLINLYGSTEVAGDVTFAVLTNATNGDANSAAALEMDSQFNKFYAPIGVPIVNNALLIGHLKEIATDESSKIFSFTCCKDGEQGELLVAGSHVAHGYHNRNQDTAAKFLTSDAVEFHGIDGTLVDFEMLPEVAAFNESFNAVPSYWDSKILFRTGDVVVRHQDGNVITWIGRSDHQVRERFSLH
jgi:non-ribosomal peptide synthetase component F